MGEEYLTNEEKVDALSLPIKDIVKTLVQKLERLAFYYDTTNEEVYLKDMKLIFAIIYHLELAYKNKAEYY